jgi:uncharacterized SAM-binding protein YcdF (DUF218 family)
MFFYIAKVLGFIAQPSNFIALLIAYGSILIWTAWARWGRRFVCFGAAMLLIAGLSSLGNLLTEPLEDRFPRTDLNTRPPPTGFIVLGGGESTGLSLARGGIPAVNESAERVIEAMILARRFPEAKLALSGGDASLIYKAGPEADSTATLLQAMGVDRSRMILESSSRDTYENAVHLKEVLGKQGLLGEGKRWILITSGFHMPRAMGVFRKVGFDVEPWPVDYRTGGDVGLLGYFDLVSAGLRRVDMMTHEWIGLVAYRLAGRTDALFPAP